MCPGYAITLNHTQQLATCTNFNNCQLKMNVYFSRNNSETHTTVGHVYNLRADESFYSGNKLFIEKPRRPDDAENVLLYVYQTYRKQK